MVRPTLLAVSFTVLLASGCATTSSGTPTQSSPSPAPAGSGSTVPVLRTEEAIIGSGADALGATVTIPAGPGPFPAAVLVAGSGPHDRDETFGPNKPFRDLAEGLSSRGILVLRYDKRTFARPATIDPRRVTVEDEVIRDAVMAVELLRTRKDVRPDQVFVIGHSLGALLAPEIAERARPVAGVVLLAASGRPLAQVVVEQLRYLGALPAEKLQELEKKAALLAAGKLEPTDTFLSVPVSYLVDLDKRDAIAIARRLGLPLLYMRGSRDYQVTEADESAWRTGLSGVTGASFETLPDLNHLFMKGTGKPGPAEYSTPGHVEPAVFERIARFVNAGAVRD